MSPGTVSSAYFFFILLKIFYILGPRGPPLLRFKKEILEETPCPPRYLPKINFFLVKKKFLGKIKKGFLDKRLFRAFYPKGTPWEVQKKNFDYLKFPLKIKFSLS